MAGKMEAATFVLLGLRHDGAVIEGLFKGVQEMEESTTYQLILRKGAARGALQSLQQTLLRQGRHRKFGEPGPETVRAIEAITDTARLAALTERILDVNSWDALLAE